MSDPIIRVKHLSKQYMIGGRSEKYYTLRDSLIRAATAPVHRLRNIWQGGTHAGAEPFWALRDISFDVAEGEVLGIIGRNGAGKSTLLKILSRITDPTEGSIELRGRVASLLEVGTGFHPELTGRENIFLSGAVLGMTRLEIKRKFDEIVEFAEVAKFLDTPVKRYSSGMHMRLAFSVAAHLDPEILVVDEVLAVGDTGFQKKCLGKMDDVARGGRTVLFVSHQLEFLGQLSERCIFLDLGNIIHDGPSREVIDEYIRFVCKAAPINLRQRRDREGIGRLRFTETWVEDRQGRRVRRVVSGQPVTIVATYEVQDGEVVSDVVVSFAVLTVRGLVVVDLGTDTTPEKEFSGAIPKRGRVECHIDQLPLNSGEFVYNVLARSARSGQEVEDWVKQAGVFSVEPGDYYNNGRIPGNLSLMCIDQKWNIEPL